MKKSIVQFETPAIDFDVGVLLDIEQNPVMEFRDGILHYWGQDIGADDSGFIGQRTYCYIQDLDTGQVFKILPEKVIFKSNG